jgi:hypothetical protein
VGSASLFTAAVKLVAVMNSRSKVIFCTLPRADSSGSPLTEHEPGKHQSAPSLRRTGLCGAKRPRRRSDDIHVRVDALRRMAARRFAFTVRPPMMALPPGGGGVNTLPPVGALAVPPSGATHQAVHPEGTNERRQREGALQAATSPAGRWHLACGGASFDDHATWSRGPFWDQYRNRYSNPQRLRPPRCTSQLVKVESFASTDASALVAS